MKDRQGLYGILVLSMEDGVIRFHAAPEHANAASPVLEISGVTPELLEQYGRGHTIKIEIQAKQTSEGPSGQSVCCTTKPQSNQITPNSNPVSAGLVPAGVSPNINVKAASGFGNLYPAAVLDIMADVLAGRWTLGNPEAAIDAAIAGWMEQNVGDSKRYAADLFGAIKARGCLTTVLTRLNMELITDWTEQEENRTVTIYRNRTKLLPGENPGTDNGLIGPDHPLYGLEQMAFPTDQEDIELEAAADGGMSSPSDFYRTSETVKLDGIACSVHLPPHLKDLVRGHLVRRGYEVLADQHAVAERLEHHLRHDDPERNILARLGYLLIITGLVNGFGDLTGSEVLETVFSSRSLPDTKGTSQVGDTTPKTMDIRVPRRISHRLR